MEQYQIASDELAVEIPKLRKLFETDIKALEKQLDAAGAPSPRAACRIGRSEAPKAQAGVYRDGGPGSCSVFRCKNG